MVAKAHNWARPGLGPAVRTLRCVRLQWQLKAGPESRGRAAKGLCEASEPDGLDRQRRRPVAVWETATEGGVVMEC